MSGRIPQYFIDQLLNRIDVVDLIDGYVPLKKAGANYKACCPFHNEKSPSFTVSPSKQFYHCFGCGANGSAISFLMEYDHMEFRDAIEKLASSAGLEIPTEAQGNQTKKVTTVQGIDLYELMSEVSEFYQQQLRQHADKDQAVNYLKKRGLSGKVAKRFGLGFSPEGWDTLMSSLGATAPAQKALLDTGMLTQNEKKRTYDRFRHRIMFPIHDHRGRVVGFGGRVLEQTDPNPGNPKYLNSPETPIFHKGSELYGLYAARGEIKDVDAVLVVEGYMDVVALAQAGINNAVATLGTATTPMHLQRLFRHTKNITFSFDGDRAGKAAGWKALETCLPLMGDDCQVNFLFLPDGEDPDTMVKGIGKDGFQNLIKNATPLYEFLINTLQQQADVTRLDGRAKLSKIAKPLIEQFPNGALKTLVVQRLARLTEIAPEDLHNATPQVQAPVPKQTKQNTKWSKNKQGKWQPPRKIEPAAPPAMSPVRRVISLILQYPKLAHHSSPLQDIPVASVRGMDLIHGLLKACQGNDEINTASLLERYREKSYYSTLTQLAQHHHNNIESLSSEDALLLLNATNEKIIEEFNQQQLTKIGQELERLTQKAKLTELSDEEQSLRKQLSQLIRDILK